MKQRGLSAAIDILLLFMGLNFSESTIQKLENMLESIPKEELEEKTILLKEKVWKDELTEEEALTVIENLMAV